MRRRLRKQLAVLAVLAAFFGGIGVLIFVAIYEPTPPPPPPPPTFAPLVVKSTAVFRASPDRVDLLAIVQNPNGNAGVRWVDYTLAVRAAGVIVATIPGRTFFLPGQEKPIVVLNAPASADADTVAIRFGDPDWVPVVPPFARPSFLTVSRTAKVRNGAAPVYEVKGVLANESDLDYLMVDVTGYGVDSGGSILGAGKTFVGSLLSRERREYTISWPLPEGRSVSEVRVFPEVNVFSPLAVQPRIGESRVEVPPTPSP